MMGKRVTTYKEKTVKVPVSYEYTCDTCGYVFAKGERRVEYLSQGKGKQYACYDKPCSPFSSPKGYEPVWDAKKQDYVWKPIRKEKS